MRSMNVSNARKFEIAALIDEYVFGYCWHSRSNEVQLTAISTYEQQYLQSLLNADGFPEMTKLVDSYGVPGLWAQVVAAATDASRFDRNLDRLFNGIQAELDASQSKRSRRVE
jgi:hypothetical protein